MDGLMDKKKKEIRERIITVAGELFMVQGFEKTTMDQIAAKAVVSRKTLYNYFPLKEAIADEYYRETAKEVAHETLENLSELPDTRSRLIAAISNRYRWAESNPELCGVVLMYRLKTLFQATDQKVEPNGTQSLIIDILRWGQEAGEIRTDIPIKMIFSYIDYLRTATVMDWLKDNARSDLQRETIRLVDLVLNGALIRPEDSQSYD